MGDHLQKPLGQKLKRFYNDKQEGAFGMTHANTPLRERGFTLVELLVTIMVLGIVITSLGGLYYTMQANEVESQHYDVAVRAARTEIEDLRNSGYDSLTPGSTITFTGSLPSALPSNKIGIVAVSEPLSGLRRVDVTVAYTDYGKAKTVTLSSEIGIVGLGQAQ